MAEKGDTNGASPEAFLDAGSYMVMRCVADRVLPVYLSAIELALSLGTNAHSTLSTEVVTRHADLWFSAMVPRTAERNARVIEATHRVLLGLAKAPSIGCRALMLHVLVVCPTKVTPTATRKASNPGQTSSFLCASTPGLLGD